MKLNKFEFLYISRYYNSAKIKIVFYLKNLKKNSSRVR